MGGVLVIAGGCGIVRDQLVSFDLSIFPPTLLKTLSFFYVSFFRVFLNCLISFYGVTFILSQTTTIVL